MNRNRYNSWISWGDERLPILWMLLVRRFRRVPRISRRRGLGTAVETVTSADRTARVNELISRAEYVAQEVPKRNLA